MKFREKFRQMDELDKLIIFFTAVALATTANAVHVVLDKDEASSLVSQQKSANTDCKPAL